MKTTGRWLLDNSTKNEYVLLLDPGCSRLVAVPLTDCADAAGVVRTIEMLCGVPEVTVKDIGDFLALVKINSEVI